MALQRGFFAGKVNRAFVYHLIFKSGLYAGTTGQQSQHDQLSAIANSYVETRKGGKHPAKEIDNSFNQQLKETIVLLGKRASKNPHVKLTCSDLVSGQFVLSFQDQESPQNNHKIHFVVQKEKGHILLRTMKDRDHFILFCKQYWNEVEKLGVLKVDMLVDGLKNHEAQLAEARILNKVQPRVLTEKEKNARFEAEMKDAKEYDASKAAVVEAPASPASSISSLSSSSSSENSPVVSYVRHATVDIEVLRESPALQRLPLIRVKS